MGDAQGQGLLGRSVLHLCIEGLPIDRPHHQDVAQLGAALNRKSPAVHLHIRLARHRIELTDAHLVVGVLALFTQHHHHEVTDMPHLVAQNLTADACSPVPRLATHEACDRNQKRRVVVRHILGAETLAVVLGNEAGVELPTHELRVGQQGGLEGDVTADAADHEGVERLSHL